MSLLNNCKTCKYSHYIVFNNVTGYYCTYGTEFKKISFPLFKGGKKCECYVNYKGPIKRLTSYPKKEDK